MQYYGDKEIVSIGDKSVDGLHLVKFKDDTTTELSDLTISNAVTDKPIDATSLREKRCFPVVAEILKILLNANVHISEIDFITQRVIMSINESCRIGNEKLWGVSEQEQTMIQIQRVLIPEKEQGVPSPFTKNNNK